MVLSDRNDSTLLHFERGNIPLHIPRHCTHSICMLVRRNPRHAGRLPRATMPNQTPELSRRAETARFTVA